MAVHSEEYYMKLAFNEARKSLKYGDVPIGAIIVKGDTVIGRGYNQIERKKDSLAHAELLAIKKAMKKNDYKHLLDCRMYVTLEPCVMCSGAIVLSRIKEVVIGCMDPKSGACGSLFHITEDKRLNHRCSVRTGVMKNECSQLLKEFFNELRKRKK